MSCAKAAELIEMPFGIWTLVFTRKDVLGGAADWVNLAIVLNRPYAAAMRPVLKLL